MCPTKTNHKVVSHCKGIQVKMKIILTVLAKNITSYIFIITTHTYIQFICILHLYFCCHMII